MSAAIGPVDDVVGSVDRLQVNLKKDKSRQVRSQAERTLIKATAHAWFQNHRSRIEAIVGAGALANLNALFTELLELADRNATRERYLGSLRAIRTDLISLRSDSLQQSKPTVASSAPAPDFSPLVTDARMGGILERRWLETQTCLQGGAHLAATVMMGGLLEGLLLARVNRVANLAPIFTAPNAPKDKAGKTLKLSEWMLKDFLNVSHDVGWIARSTKDVGAVVRDYRNYIHPQKEFTHGISLDADETSVLWTVFQTIARQIIASVSKAP